MRIKAKSDVPVSKSPPAVVAPTTPAASVDDTAAFLREAPLLVEVLRVEVPPKVPARGATFAQQDLRKLDADLSRETDYALVELAKVGPARLALDLGPATARLRDLDAVWFPPMGQVGVIPIPFRDLLVSSRIPRTCPRATP